MTVHHRHPAPQALPGTDRLLYDDVGKPAGNEYEAPAFPADDPLRVDLVEITDRLASVAAGTYTHDEVSALVRQCRADLSGAPPAALPELVERLARQRLIASHTPVESSAGAGY